VYLRDVICKVLNPRQLDRVDIYPTYNSKSYNFYTYTWTLNAQARVWQLATATPDAADKHMLIFPTRTSLARQLA